MTLTTEIPCCSQYALSITAVFFLTCVIGFLPISVWKKIICQLTVETGTCHHPGTWASGMAHPWKYHLQ